MYGTARIQIQLCLTLKLVLFISQTSPPIISFHTRPRYPNRSENLSQWIPLPESVSQVLPTHRVLSLLILTPTLRCRSLVFHEKNSAQTGQIEFEPILCGSWDWTVNYSGTAFPQPVKGSTIRQVTDDRNHPSRPVLQAARSPTAWPARSSWSNDRCTVCLTVETRNHSAGWPPTLCQVEEKQPQA